MRAGRWGSFRLGYLGMALLSAALLGYAYYAQFVLHLEPCPLCILQRVAFMGFFLVCLVAVAHGPRGGGRYVYAALAVVCAVAGLAVAGRHVWLQHLPADKVPDCGPGLGYMLEAFPVSKTIKMVFTGSGECAKVDWQFLGLSMPEWSLLWFAGLLLGAVFFAARRRGRFTA